MTTLALDDGEHWLASPRGEVAGLLIKRDSLRREAFVIPTRP